MKLKKYIKIIKLNNLETEKYSLRMSRRRLEFFVNKLKNNKT